MSALSGIFSGIGSVIVAVLLLGVLITLHELGHFSAARALRLPVEEFAIGFGPAIWKRQKGDTRFSIRILPIGGFCAFYGEDQDNPDPRAYNRQPAWKRLVSIFSGPLANLLAGLLLTLFLLTVIGQSVVTATVGSVDDGLPAQAAGMMQGDVIRAINDVQVNGDYTVAQHAIEQNGEQALTIIVERQGVPVSLSMTPFYDQEMQRARIGMTFASDTVRMGFGEAIGYSFSYCYNMVKEMLIFFRDLFFKGQGLDGITGPVGTVATISRYVPDGIATVLSLAVLISINLALVNLLPLPALDGARMIFVLIEIIFRKPVPREKEAWVHAGGLVLLLGLIVLVTVRDIIRMFGGA